MLKKITILILLLAVSFLAYRYFQPELSQSKKIQKDEVTQAAGFDVLLPVKLPDDFYYNGYTVEDKAQTGGKTAVIQIKGKDGQSILMTQSVIPKPGEDLGVVVNRLFSNSSPQKIEISKYSAYVLTKPSHEKDSQTTLLLWNDEVRHINIWFSPASEFSNANVVTFAESLYQQ